MGTHFRLGGETGDQIFPSALVPARSAASQPEPLWKSSFDKVFALFALVFFAPFIVLVALALLVSERGPVFFPHTRVGRGGRPFQCWKFRTMVVDADARLAEYLASDAEAREAWELYRKLPHDPRITCLGKFLRKTSLDELPQFWNVLVGEMSVVGPRPIVRDEARHYGDAFGNYLAVRPGITGLWQVSGRSDCGYVDRVALDSEYVQTRSLWGDIRIVARTVKVVLRQDGAC